MSNYNWERGTIKIPSKEWKTVRDRIVKAANESRADLLGLALKAHARLSDKAFMSQVREAVKTVNKATRANERILLSTVTPLAIHEAANDWDADHDDYNGEFTSVLTKALRRVNLTGIQIKSDYHDNDDWLESRLRVVRALLFPRIVPEDGTWATERKRLAKPRKSDDIIKPFVATKIESITCREASLYFDHKAKTLTWDVDENNRSVERAAGTWLSKAFHGALKRVTWTRGSGGKIVGNDQYNKDDRDDGGGSNYVNCEYGVEASKRESARNSSYSSFRRY